MKSLVKSVLSILSVAALAVSVAFGGPAPSYALGLHRPQVAVLPGLKGVFAGTRPDNLGASNGQLAACPASPNCVVSQGGDAEHAIAPIAYSTDRETARQNLIDILGVVPRTKVVEQREDYILAESESRLMGFVDDSEFYLPKGENLIQVRAAARLGESDLGVNRRRIEQIRLAFQDLEQRAAAQPSE